MFWIFKIFADWVWWLLLFAGIIGVLLSYLALLKPYHLLLKIVGLVTVAVALFILGMLHADHTWQAAARELEAKVVAAEARSQQVNEVVKEKLVTRTQVVRVRGEETVKYIDREVVKINSNCVVSPEFVQAHNTSTEPTK